MTKRLRTPVLKEGDYALFGEIVNPDVSHVNRR